MRGGTAHARAQQRLHLVGRVWFHREALEHGPDGLDVGRQVVGGGVGDVVEKARADQRAERGRAQPDRRGDEVDGADPVLAVGAQAVADDEGLQRRRLCHRGHLPPPRVDRLDRIVAGERPGRIGRERRILPAGMHSLPSRDA
jgi:hypothetical protein